MVMLLRNKKISDYFIYIVCISMLAFHDKSFLVIPAQIIFFLSIISEYLRDGKLIVPHYSKKYIIRYLLFVFICIISILWTIDDSTWIQINISIIQCVVVGVSIIYYEQSEKRIENTLNSIIIASIILCVRLAISTPLSAWGSERVGVHIGYGNVGVSYVLATVAVIAIFMAIGRKSYKYYILSAVFIAISALTGTKKGLIVALVGIFILILKSSKNPLKLLRNMFVLFLLACVGWYALMNVDVFYNAIGKRFVTALLQLTGEGLDKSTRDRALLIGWGLETFYEHPLFGVGIDAFRFANANLIHYYAHNNYIELLADLGILGTIIYYYLLFKESIIGLFTKYRAGNYTILALSIMISLLVGDFSSVSYSQETLQLYLAVSFGMLSFERGKIK